MIRVHIICEGQTEEMFVKELMRPPFAALGIELTPALIGKPGHKGGNFKYERLLVDVRKRLLEDTQSYCTTFFDFYGLPEDFPGKRALPNNVSIEDKANAVNTALREKLKKQLGEGPLRRFIPFVQMYEFEALLFSNPKAFAEGIYKPAIEVDLQQIAAQFSTPEHINDSPQTAPSKRVLALVKGYEKPLMGSLAAIEMGLNTIKQKCHIFNGWIKSLEALSYDRI